MANIKSLPFPLFLPTVRLEKERGDRASSFLVVDLRDIVLSAFLFLLRPSRTIAISEAQGEKKREKVEDRGAVSPSSARAASIEEESPSPIANLVSRE